MSRSLRSPVAPSLVLPYVALLVASTLGACRASEAPPREAPAPAAEVSAWAGSQHELADAIDAASQSVEPDAKRAVRARWHGRKVRWEVGRVPQLCGAQGPCYVQPFASARRSEAGAHGWLPELAFAPGERERMVGECGEQALCRFTVEATVSELVVSDEEPTSIRLDSARLVELAARR